LLCAAIQRQLRFFKLPFLALRIALSFAPVESLVVATACARRSVRPRHPGAARTQCGGTGFLRSASVWFGVGISWIYISLHVYGQMWAWLAALATALLAAFLALYPALALGLSQRFVPAPSARLLLALPAAWTASEWLRVYC